MRTLGLVALLFVIGSLLTRNLVHSFGQPNERQIRDSLGEQNTGKELDTGIQAVIAHSERVNRAQNDSIPENSRPPSQAQIKALESALGESRMGREIATLLKDPERISQESVEATLKEDPPSAFEALSSSLDSSDPKDERRQMLISWVDSVPGHEANKHEFWKRIVAREDLDDQERFLSYRHVISRQTPEERLRYTLTTIHSNKGTEIARKIEEHFRLRFPKDAEQLSNSLSTPSP